VLLLAFVLVTLAAWTGHRSFDSVVQSVLVGGLSASARSWPAKMKAEGKDLDDLVEQLMGNQTHDAGDE